MDGDLLLLLWRLLNNVTIEINNLCREISIARIEANRVIVFVTNRNFIFNIYY